jgi:multimeric flavodoxin WrbA
MKHLLIVYHTQTGNTGKLAAAVREGASSELVDDVDVRFLRVREAAAEDLLWADGLLLGTPENFGYMSGAMKDFFDRTFYAVEGRILSLPYAVFISAGNDGTGALSAIRRIANGYPFKEVQEPVIAKAEINDEHLAAAHDLGLALAAGLEANVY